MALVALCSGSGCGQRKHEARNSVSPKGKADSGHPDSCVVFRADRPLDCIFFICEASVPGGGAPQVGFAGGHSNLLLRTTDGGRTWHHIVQTNPTAASFKQILFRDPKHGWVVSRDRLLCTGDGGQTWQAAPELPGNFYYFGAGAVNSNRYFQIQTPGCGASLYAVSTAGGAWQKWHGTLPRNDYETMFFLDDQYGWLAGNYGRYAFTTNGGATWLATNIQNGGHLAQIQFLTPKLGWMRPVMNHDGGLWATKDGGVTWQKQNAGVKSYSNLVDMHFFDENLGYLLIDAGPSSAELLKTCDGGASWTFVRAFNAPVKAFCLVSSNAAWFASRDGAILHCVF